MIDPEKSLMSTINRYLNLGRIYPVALAQTLYLANTNATNKITF